MIIVSYTGVLCSTLICMELGWNVYLLVSHFGLVVNLLQSAGSRLYRRASKQYNIQVVFGS